MSSITYQELQAIIAQMENRQSEEWVLLQESIHDTYENLKPINFIKNTISELTSAPEFAEEMIDTTLGLAVGYISKEIVLKNSDSPYKKLLGTLVQITLTNLVSKNIDSIKSFAMFLVRKVNPTKE